MDMLAALDALKLGRFSVLGEGWAGARIACSIAASRPNDVEAVILSSPGAFVE